MGDNICIMLRRSPFSTVRNFEALRSCVGLSMGDSPLTMVFVEDGVYTLSAKGKPLLEGFDWNKHLEMLKELEFELVVDGTSAKERGVTEFNHEPSVKSRDEIAAILRDAKAVITY
ncbi:MAG TPA: DsrE family protein [Nitrospirota bacterium]|nr:DsrE family protein [Nitrospirota bacterium]